MADTAADGGQGGWVYKIRWCEAGELPRRIQII